MATRLVQVNIKARDDSALGRFWAEALGWGVSSEGPGVTNVEPVGFAWPDPVAVCIDVVTVPDPETVKYRAHLDLATTSAAHQAELVARLEDLGATPADVGQGDVPWTVLADPEGNVFCVLEPREIYRDTRPIAAVVVDCADPRAMARFWGEAMDGRCSARPLPCPGGWQHTRRPGSAPTGTCTSWKRTRSPRWSRPSRANGSPGDGFPGWSAPFTSWPSGFP